MRFKRLISTAALATTSALAAHPATAQEAFSVTDTSGYRIAEAEEIALARSAAPAHISDDATIITLGADGSYRTAEEGSNGWTCFVGRSWTGPAPIVDGRRAWNELHFHPELRAPQCFNAEASGSHLAMHRITTHGFMNGADSDQVDAMVGHALASGAIQPPEPGAMSYMYSPRQVLRPGGERFFPHVMLYMPYATQADFGARNGNMTIPMVTDAGSIFATTVIMSSHWSDGTPVQ